MPNNYLVIGPGRTGLFWAYALACGGGSVLLHGRGEKYKELLEGSDHITAHWHQPDGTIEAHTVHGVRYIGNYAKLSQGPESWIVVPAVRSYQIRDVVGKAAVWLKDRLDGVLVPTNGIEGEPIVEEVLDASSRIFSASLTLPCEKDASDPRAVHIMNSKGGVGLAAYAETGLPPLSGITQNFRQCRGLEVMDHRAHWLDMKFTKLAMNVIANVLCGLTVQAPRELYRNWQMAALELHLLHEIDIAMKTLGLKLVDLPGYPASTLRKIFAIAWFSKITPQLMAQLYQALVVPKILRSRGEKEPSLLQEMRGRVSQVENLPGQVLQAIGGSREAPHLRACRFLGTQLDEVYRYTAGWGPEMSMYHKAPILLWRNYRRAR